MQGVIESAKSAGIFSVGIFMVPPVYAAKYIDTHRDSFTKPIFHLMDTLGYIGTSALWIFGLLVLFVVTRHMVTLKNGMHLADHFYHNIFLPSATKVTLAGLQSGVASGEVEAAGGVSAGFSLILFSVMFWPAFGAAFIEVLIFFYTHHANSANDLDFGAWLLVGMAFIAGGILSYSITTRLMVWASWVFIICLALSIILFVIMFPLTLFGVVPLL